MDILNNAWFIGIVGGICSGIVVYIITRHVFSNDKGYIQNISAVNKEVVYALRSGISEGHMPDEKVISSLIEATARKYKVERDDVFRPKQIAEDLIKEIMDSSFISSKTKKKYCDILAHLITEKIEKMHSESYYRNRLVTNMSVALGMITTATMLFYLVLSEGVSKIFDITVLELIIIITSMTATFVAFLVMRLKKLMNAEEYHKKSDK